LIRPVLRKICLFDRENGSGAVVRKSAADPFPQAEPLSLSTNVRGYDRSPKNASFDLLNRMGLIGTVRGDIDDLRFLLDPGPAPEIGDQTFSREDSAEYERPCDGPCAAHRPTSSAPETHPISGLLGPSEKWVSDDALPECKQDEGRRSACPRAPAAVEQVLERKDEAWQDVAAVKRLIRADEDRMIVTRKDPRGAFLGIDQPDHPDPGLEVFPHFAGHFRFGVPLAEHFDGKVGRQVRDRIRRMGGSIVAGAIRASSCFAVPEHNPSPF